MLSRRNVRIKVMQSIYNWMQDKELSERGAVKHYRSSVALSFELLIFNIRNIVLISRMAVDDKAQRRKKFLPTEEDRIFEPILYRNPLIAALEKNETYQDHQREAFNRYLDVSQARKLYNTFAQTDIYRSFFTKDEYTDEDYIQIFLDLWKFLCTEYLYIELIYDAYPNWIDDDSLVKGFVKRTIRGILYDDQMLKSFKPDKETTEDFGKELLEDVMDNFQNFEEKMIPNLQNWSIDRIASVDKILIKMALSEFTNFPSIPTKVTINEYVDIAKMYSTDKSKDFLNGILDSLLKDLIEAEKVHKEGRGLLQ